MKTPTFTILYFKKNRSVTYKERLSMRWHLILVFPYDDILNMLREEHTYICHTHMYTLNKKPKPKTTLHIYNSEPKVVRDQIEKSCNGKHI